MGNDDYWTWVSWADMQQGDWFVYNSDGAGHIGIVDEPDAGGSIVSYEAQCTACGIVHESRNLSSIYSIAHRVRRIGSDADADGFTEAEGDCNDTNPAVHPGASPPP